MYKATTLMGINNASTSTSRAFAKDVLSIEIEGPSRPQLTLVDLPGLVQTETHRPLYFPTSDNLSGGGLSHQ